MLRFPNSVGSLTINTFEELENYLRNWERFDGDAGQEDAVGIIYLFNACLENLRAHANYFEFEQLPFSDESVQFMRKMVEYCEANPEAKRLE